MEINFSIKMETSEFFAYCDCVRNKNYTVADMHRKNKVTEMVQSLAPSIDKIVESFCSAMDNLTPESCEKVVEILYPIMAAYNGKAEAETEESKTETETESEPKAEETEPEAEAENK